VRGRRRVGFTAESAEGAESKGWRRPPGGQSWAGCPCHGVRGTWWQGQPFNQGEAAFPGRRGESGNAAPPWRGSPEGVSPSIGGSGGRMPSRGTRDKMPAVQPAHQ